MREKIAVGGGIEPPRSS